MHRGYKNIHSKAIPTPVFSAMGLLLLFICSFASAQEMRVSGEASSLMVNPHITRLQYEQQTLEAAKNNAIDKAFGSSVTSNYERFSSVEMQGRSVAAQTEVRSNYLNSYPNGEWIKDISQHCKEEKDGNGKWWMNCSVTGMARELKAAEVKFVAKTLDGENSQMDGSEQFISGESGYLYFKCTDPGYLLVFYDDMKFVQRCIPYNSMPEKSLKVDSNKEYIFFSQDKANYLEDPHMVDEIEFYTDDKLEYNQFYVLYSPRPFRGYFLDDPKEYEDGYSSFHSMSRESFQSWLQKNRIRNEDIQVQIIGITVSSME